MTGGLAACVRKRRPLAIVAAFRLKSCSIHPEGGREAPSSCPSVTSKGRRCGRGRVSEMAQLCLHPANRPGRGVPDVAPESSPQAACLGLGPRLAPARSGAGSRCGRDWPCGAGRASSPCWSGTRETPFPPGPEVTHVHTLTHAHTHTLINTHTHSLMLSHTTHTMYNTHMYTLTCALICSITHTHTYAHICTHTLHTHSHTLIP